MKNLSTLYILLFAALFMGCSSDNEEEVLAHKGAKTPLMQAIADGHERIQLVKSDKAYSLAEGVTLTEATFTYYTRTTQLFVAEVDLTKSLELVPCTPNNENVQGPLQTIPEQMQHAAEAGQEILLGINGDFFGKNPNGKYFTMNVFAKDGVVLKETFSSGYEGVLVVLKDGTTKLIHPEEFADLKGDVQHALGGYHTLVKEGEVNSNLGTNDLTMNFDPRTFIGLSQDGTKCYLFVIDGRQKAYSDGMRLEDVATLCKAAGCYNALNLDGGGSATFVVKNEKGEFEVKNRPSDGAPRPVINGLTVVKK